MLLQIYPYAGYGWLSQALAWLEAIGLLESIIPFILIFTVLYAILDRTQILGEKARKINMAIALAIALIPVLQHVAAPSPYDAISVMNRALPSVVLVAIALLLVLVLAGFAVGLPADKEPKVWTTLKTWAPWVVLVLVILIFISAAAIPTYPWANLLWQLFDPYVVALVLAILVAVLLIAWVTGE